MRKRLVKHLPVEKQDDLDLYPQVNNYIGAKKLNEQGVLGSDIVVAVLDTGCDTNHVDLKDNIIEGYNFTDDYEGNFFNFVDNNGHGTHVSGIISGLKTGVAPGAKLLILKVLDAKGSGNVQSLVNAIYFAVNWRGPKKERVRIINMSLGLPFKDDNLHEAIKYSVNAGIPVVSASGNDGDGNQNTNEYRYPAAYNEVIQVGAIDFKDNIANFSNSNNEVDLYAPGVKIYSTYLGNKYKILSGTSMATPIISGSIALLIESLENKLSRTMNESEIYAQLIKRTRTLTSASKEELNGCISF